MMRKYRQRRLQEEAHGAEALGGALPAAFVFGDFNFRLDLSQVVQHLCGATGLAQVTEHSGRCRIRALALSLASALPSPGPSPGPGPAFGPYPCPWPCSWP